MANVDQFFTIKSELDNTTFRATFADGAPLVVEGYAGWQVISRPRNVGVVEWQGRNPMAIEIPFMIDFWMDDEGDIRPDPGVRCEAQVSNIEKLCGIGGHKQPPVCTVDSQGVIPHDLTIWKNGRWVVEALVWDRAIELRTRTTGRRVRCGGTITIREFLTSRDILRRIGPRTRASIPRPYIVKKGDSLSKIANIMYKDPSKWKIIADANNIRDRRHLKRGDHLKIPKL